MATIPEISGLVDKYVISEQPSGNSPRLMLVYHGKLSMAQHEMIRKSLEDVLESGKPVVLDGGVEVFQLVDDRWLHLDGSIELEDAPLPKKVSFRKFL